MKPRLLLSNDDGLDSPFLPTFAKALAEVADLQIVVPSRERSWIGRAYCRHEILEAKRVDFFGLDCQTVSGTPADCVNIALAHLCGETPDAVVSGLNIGQNVALPLLWSSGTFAAAVEGAGWGVSAFAFSMRLEKIYYEYCRLRHGAAPEPLLRNIEAASEHAAEFLIECLERGECGGGRVVNVNYPIQYNRAKPFVKCVPANAELRSVYKKCGGGKFEFSYSLGEVKSPNGAKTDIECLDDAQACYSVIDIRG